MTTIKQFILGMGVFLFASAMMSCNTDNCPLGADSDSCACYEIYAPVCGCNDVTYANDCHAECAGVTNYTEGECP